MLSLNDRRILTYEPTTKNFRIMAVGFDEDVLDFLVTKRIFDSIALWKRKSIVSMVSMALDGFP